MKMFQYSLLILSLNLLNSCEREYYYLTDSAKEYLFYDKGDNLIFINENDTLYGYVDYKEFWTTSNGIFGTVYHEIGQVHVKLLNDTNDVTVFLEVINNGDKIEISYEFYISNLSQEIDSCMKDHITFNAFIFNGSLYSYDLESLKYFKILQIGAESYELLYKNEYCISQQSKLHINKAEGLTLIIFNESDTIAIKRI